MRYRALLFDLDGTLLDTLRDIAEAANRVLVRMGFPTHAIEAYRNFVGEGMEVLARKVLPEDQRNENVIQKTTAMIEEEYSQRWEKNTRIYPGIAELLDVLTSEGTRMAVLSNKPEGFVREMVSRLLSRWHFEVVAGASPGMPKKPDPKAAIWIASKMDLRTSEFIYLGDSAVDMKTAAAAEMFPVGVLWGFRTEEELLSAGAKVLLRKPSELLYLIHYQTMPGIV